MAHSRITGLALIVLAALGLLSFHTGSVFAGGLREGQSVPQCKDTSEFFAAPELDAHILLSFYLEEHGLLSEAAQLAGDRSLREGREVLFTELDLTALLGEPLPSVDELRVVYRERFISDAIAEGGLFTSADPSEALAAACTNVCTKNCSKKYYANGQAAYNKAPNNAGCPAGYYLYYGYACTTQKYCSNQ